MKKILKYGLLVLGIILVLLVGAISYFMATFNPNAYKSQIIQAVKEKQQRTLKLDGDIKLTIFPSIGAKAANISLSEFQSKKEFASVDSVRVSIALLPLFSKQLVVNEVGLSGVKVKVVKFKDGSSNLDDLAGKKDITEEVPPPAGTKAIAPVQFDIASVEIENTELSYRDEKTGSQYSLKGLNLKTGRILNGVPGKIKLDAMIQSNKPKLDIAANLQTTLTFDLEKKFYRIEDLDMQVKGSALDFSKLQIKATGDASANLATQEFKTSNLEVSGSGVKGKDNFNISLDLPALNFTKDNVSADKLTANASLDGETGKVIANLTLQDLKGNAQSFKSSGLLLDVGLTQPEQAFKLKLSTPLVGSLDSKQINLSNLVFAVNATGDKLPNKSISSEMKGSAQIDADRESVQLNLAGGLLQSQVKAKLALKGFSQPAIRFDVDIDQFDADLYLPTKAAKESENETSAPEQPFDLTALQKLNMEGSLRIGSLKVFNVKSSKLRIDMKAKKGQVNISPLSANLYQGSMNGNVEINAMPAIPTFTVKQTLNGVQLGPLIKDAADYDMLEGKGNATVNLATQGNTVSAIKKNLNGNAALNMESGAIKGINLTKLVHGAQNIGKSSAAETLKPDAGDRTEFNELKASFKVNKGVAHNDDLLIKSQSLRVTGSGDIDIGNSSINYATKTTLADSVDTKNGSMTVPVALQGPFADLKFKVDYGAIVADVAKQKLNAKVDEKREQLKQELQEKLKGGLKNLFK